MPNARLLHLQSPQADKCSPRRGGAPAPRPEFRFRADHDARRGLDRTARRRLSPLTLAAWIEGGFTVTPGRARTNVRPMGKVLRVTETVAEIVRAHRAKTMSPEE